MGAIVVWTTTADKASAVRLARGLVTQRLAACVSVVPGVVSTYRWKGKVRKAGESLLVIKTTEAAWKGLERFIRDRHPYEVPELLALPVKAGSKEYLAWLEENVR